jgi:hypothetical protein
MIQRRLRIALAAAAALLPTAAGAGEPVGFVAAVRGFAEVKATEGPFTMAVLDRDVAVGDVVRTRDHGWIKMLLADDTTLAVDAGSELRIERFAGAEGTRVALRAGHVRTRLADARGPGGPLTLTTPHARVEAQGTEWLTWLEADATWVCAVAGEVRIHAAAGSLAISSGDCARAADTLHKASRPRRLRAVAMRPGAVPARPAFPAKAAGPSDPAAGDLAGSDPLVIDVNDLLGRNAAEDVTDGRPPASAAIP